MELMKESQQDIEHGSQISQMSLWDTILVFEGALSSRQNAYGDNHPLGDFFEALPKMAVRELHPDVQSRISLIHYELCRVDFKLPTGFTHKVFWPIGLPNQRRQWPFQGRIDRMLVISPFTAAECLHKLTEKGQNHALVSRLECIEPLTAAQLQPFENQLYVLSPDASADETEQAETPC